MTYDFCCGQCGARFERSVPCGTPTVGCACGAAAQRQFSLPSAAQICIPCHMPYTRAWSQPLSTPQHTSDYLAQEVMEKAQAKMAAVYEQQAKVESFPDFFKRTNPDIDPHQRLTTTESQQVKEALGVTPHA